MHARVDLCDVRFAARLNEHGAPRVAELAHERQDAGLEQGFAAGHLDERRVEREGLFKHVRAAHARAAFEGLRRVAPRAAQVAARRAHEGARHPGEGRFALDACVDLVNDERVFLGHAQTIARYHAPSGAQRSRGESSR